MVFPYKNILVVGMARSGIATAKMLCQMDDIRVTINDKKTREEFEGGLCELEGLNIAWRLGEDPCTLLEGKDMVVFSSGVPDKSEFVQKAKSMGIPAINELELGFMVSKARFVGITGTNGKTTTTTLVSEIFRNAGLNAWPLGNIGVPVTTEALHAGPRDVIIAEVAPFQLISTITFKPLVSAILNITEDHLDWFGTMENYIAGKSLVFKNQTPEDFCVLNLDNAITASLAQKVKARVLFFSRKQVVSEGTYIKDGDLLWRINGDERRICKAEEIRIPGAHNLENALAAAAITAAMGIQLPVIRYTLMTFPGVEHRIEYVCEKNGIHFINDSKGTNPDATIKAIEAMTKPTILILGGYDKHLEFDPIFQNEAFQTIIAGIVTLGQTTNQIMNTAHRYGYKRIEQASTFVDAVKKAFRMAEPGQNVLLSPACASWDMFKDFEERGRIFKEAAKGLGVENVSIEEKTNTAKEQ